MNSIAEYVKVILIKYAILKPKSATKLYFEKIHNCMHNIFIIIDCFITTFNTRIGFIDQGFVLILIFGPPALTETWTMKGKDDLIIEELWMFRSALDKVACKKKVVTADTIRVNIP